MFLYIPLEIKNKAGNDGINNINLNLSGLIKYSITKTPIIIPKKKSKNKIC